MEQSNIANAFVVVCHGNDISPLLPFLSLYPFAQLTIDPHSSV